jgi:hypothetical protein
MKTYGIKIYTPQIALTLMANIEVAAREDLGRGFRPALQNIRAKYTYNHTHDDASLKDILQELAKADSVQTPKDAPAPGTTNAVTTMLETMRTMVATSSDRSDSSNNDYTESSLGASSDNDDDESMATTSTRGCRRKDKTKKDKANNKKGKDDKSGKRKKKNDCLHCKKLGQTCPHSHPPPTNASGTKATKDGAHARYATNWKLNSNQSQSSAPKWEDGRSQMNDGVGGQQTQRKIRKTGGR